MRRGRSFRLLAVALPFLAATIAPADEVVLKNGDRLTGAVVRKDGKTLVVETALFGNVAAPWEQVEALTAEQALTVTLADGTVLETPLQIAAGGATLSKTGRRVTAEEIVTLRNAAEQTAYERLLAPGWGDLWAGTAAVGLAGTQGNAQTRTFTLAMNAARRSNSDKTSVYLNVVKASALINQVGTDTAQAVRGGWGYSRTFAGKLSADIFNDYEYDRFQDLDLRFVLGGGFGYSPWRSGRGRLDLSGGGAFNREQFGPPAPADSFSRRSAEVYWGDDYSYKLTEATSLVQKLRVFHNLSTTGQYRLNFDLNANTRLLRWLTWNVGFSDRYLSNPVPGSRKNDILYTTGIGVSFAR